MTLMIILGAAASLYMLILLFRCATFALPVLVAVSVGARLHETGHSWQVAILVGLLTGVATLEMARHLLRSRTPCWLRFATILSFAGAAAAAGYQAAAALSHLFGVGAAWQHPLAVLTGLVTACSSWRDLVARAANATIPLSPS